jgi:hypothetical protein
VNLNGAPIDPATGQPLADAGWDSYGQESAGGEAGVEEESLETADAALPGLAPEPAALPQVRVTYPPARTFPPRPVEIDPADSTAAVTTGEGSILIRPSRHEPEPPSAAEAPVGVAPVGVVPPAEETPPPP